MALGHLAQNFQQAGGREWPEAEAKPGGIRSPGPELSAGRREGKVNGMSCPVTFDTGANVTVVPGRFSAPMQFTGKNIRVVLANMDTTSMREAVLSIEVDGKAQSLTVIALKDEAPEVLLGTDHEVTRELLNPKPIGQKSEVISQVEVCAITRAKSQAQKKEWDKDMVADTRDGAEHKESFTSLVDPVPDKPAKSSPIPYQLTDGNGYREMKEVVVGPNISPWGEERAGVEEEERFEDEEEKFEDEEERFEDEKEKFEDEEEKFEDEEERFEDEKEKFEDEEEKFEEEEEDEVEEDSSVEVEAESLTGLEGEGVELSNQLLPALCKGREEVRVLVQQQKTMLVCVSLGRKERNRLTVMCMQIVFWYTSKWRTQQGNGPGWLFPHLGEERYWM